MATPNKKDKPEDTFIRDGEPQPVSDTAGEIAPEIGAESAAVLKTDDEAASSADAPIALQAMTSADAAGTEGDENDTLPAPFGGWYTVQVLHSPSGKRFRAGIEFSTQPVPYDFSLFTREQVEKLRADPFLRIKPYTPSEA